MPVKPVSSFGPLFAVRLVKWYPRKGPNDKETIIGFELGTTHKIESRMGSRKRITFLYTEHRTASSVKGDPPTSVSEIRDEKRHLVVLANTFDPESPG